MYMPEPGILDVIAVTLDGESGHFPKSSHKRSYLQKLDRSWQGGGGCEISRKCGGSRRSRPFPISRPSFGSAFGEEGRLFHVAEHDSNSTVCESNYGDGSRSGWAHYPERAPKRPAMNSEHSLDSIPKESNLLAPQREGDKERVEEKRGKWRHVLARTGHSLFQELFFFCTIKNMGDVPGAGCIYVETVVDRDSGIAFAKVYSAQNRDERRRSFSQAASCPFLSRQGVAIREIHTRRTSEYCGLPPVHPFETFLATSHIQHLRMDNSSRPDNHLCEQFYRLLLKEFLHAGSPKKISTCRWMICRKIWMHLSKRTTPCN